MDRKWTYRKIADHMGCSLKMVFNAFNAITHYSQHRTSENVPRKFRPRKTTPHEDKLIIRLAKKDSFKGSNLIRKEVFSEHDSRNVSARLVRRKLVEAKLYGRIARKIDEKLICRTRSVNRNYLIQPVEPLSGRPQTSGCRAANGHPLSRPYADLRNERRKEVMIDRNIKY
ncbi:hypothetical protein MSG28_008624 [Choristoneura fumiferana]|uniref:Uncharacterized protein n=1 Tax=Choristoneura fumiferana TaxID=7141 RepID=A0ACC0J7G7_CHOFU|nr:hypothetical protein MSG28_008624 [Choristoneura fumiferana]